MTVTFSTFSAFITGISSVDDVLKLINPVLPEFHDVSEMPLTTKQDKSAGNGVQEFTSFIRF